MPLDCLTRTGFTTRKPAVYKILNPLRNQILKFPKTKFLFLRMVNQSAPTKRSTCPSCSKPTPFCLCNRLKTPPLQNSVSVTILQHSLEKKHPLNSARIATLGLKNVDVVTVSDVNFQARFFIWLLDLSSRVGHFESDENNNMFDIMPREREVNDCVDGSSYLKNNESEPTAIELDSQFPENSHFNGDKMSKICENNTILSRNSSFLMSWNTKSELESCGGEVASRSCSLDEATAINFTIEKYGAVDSVDQSWMAIKKWSQMNLNQMLDSDVAGDDMRKGFVVKKIQRKLNGSYEYEESEEFGIAVLPGSVLLFPSEKSVGIDAVNFEVKNLIVLDGTWAKAKRMYNENPWLTLLPHIRLDLDKLSLYGEVRHQPRAGYFSTIESIVYALKAMGEDSEGLDGLLDVFEYMVGHQLRCKDDRLIRDSKF